jgi:RNA polymerase sigma factor (sigma-70 family)
MKTTTAARQHAGAEGTLHAKQGSATGDAMSRAGLLGRIPGAMQESALRSLPAIAEVARYAADVVANGAPVTETATAVSAALSAAQEALLIEALPLVRFVARGIHERLPAHIELDELISAGTLGLVDAARKFNPTKNVQFRSYAQFRIRGAILDSLRTLDWSPRELRRKGRALQEARRAVEARLGRAATDMELASEMELSLEPCADSKSRPCMRSEVKTPAKKSSPFFPRAKKTTHFSAIWRARLATAYWPQSTRCRSASDWSSCSITSKK